MANNYWIAMQKQNSYKKMWLKLNPDLKDKSGIYILTRVDENGFKYGYVGQAKQVLTRLAQHSLGRTQHIDLSLLKHKLFDFDKNQFGWKVQAIYCNECDLDKLEKAYILEFANKGYQMRNKTIGSQSVGKASISDEQSTKGYRDGLSQGYQNCLKDIREYFEKYLRFEIKLNGSRKKDGDYKEIYLKKVKEFEELLKESKTNKEKGL